MIHISSLAIKFAFISITFILSLLFWKPTNKHRYFTVSSMFIFFNMMRWRFFIFFYRGKCFVYTLGLEEAQGLSRTAYPLKSPGLSSGSVVVIAVGFSRFNHNEVPDRPDFCQGFRSKKGRISKLDLSIWYLSTWHHVLAKEDNSVSRSFAAHHGSHHAGQRQIPMVVTKVRPGSLHRRNSGVLRRVVNTAALVAFRGWLLPGDFVRLW